MINIFVDPGYRPPIPCGPCYKRVCTPPGISLDKADQALLKKVEKAGIYGIRIWELLNLVAEEQNPGTRAETRALRLKLWQNLRQLMSRGVVLRWARSWVSVYRLPRPSVNRHRRSIAGSTLKQHKHDQPAVRKPLQIQSPCSLPCPQTKSVELDAAPLVKQLPEVSISDNSPRPPDLESVREAARLLARLPRKRTRRWTGWIGGHHCWRNQRIILPGGELVYLYGALRKKAVWTSCATGPNADLSDDNWAFGAVDADQVRLVKDPNAIILGKLKAGVREKVSEAKKRAARTNGLKACKPGRQRGRPRSPSFEGL
jgi:hypothetical protein